MAVSGRAGTTVAAAPARRSTTPAGAPGWTPIDLVQLAYVVITAMVLVVGRGIPNRWPLLAGHLVLVVGMLALGRAARRGNIWLQFLRDAYPLLLLQVWYQETAVLSRGFTSGYHDATAQAWDLAVFGRHWNAELAAAWPSPFLSELLHGCYLGYIGCVPFLGFWLYFRRRYEAFRVFATSVACTFASCFLAFVFFPVRGPYYEFPGHVVPHLGLFPPLVYGMLERGASVGAAFPSSHVAGATVVALMSFRLERRLTPFLGLLAIGIAIGTVYGGFHYAIDALAGALVGIFWAAMGPVVHARLLRRLRRGDVARRAA